MIQFIGTFANPQTTVITPNPEFNNTQALMSSVSVKQTSDGTQFVYLKKKLHEKLEWTLLVTPEKAEEVKAFIDYYIGDYIRVVDMNSNVWRVLLSNENFIFTAKTRDNWIEIQLELQGVKING